MKNEEAIKILAGYIHRDVPKGIVSHNEHNEAVLKAIEALKNADKYKWHDLLKDPNDLPDEDGIVFIAVRTHEIENKKFINTIGYNDSFYNAEKKSFNAGIYSNMVLAWKYRENFEEEE